MAIVRIAITKSTIFQGKRENWSNVYTVDVPDTTTTRLKAAADNIMEAERAIHGTNVDFIETRAYDFLGTPAENQTHFIEDKAVAGISTSAPGMYRECAFLVKFPLPRNPATGRKRRLSKWLHCCAIPGNIAGGDGTEGGEGMIANEARTALSSYANKIVADPISVSSGARVVAPNGDHPTTFQIHDFLEHRQFHQGPQRIKAGQVL